MQMKCWICGADADSREHLVKASDIRSVFGAVSQNKPLFYHTDQRRNLPVRGVKADILKYRKRICAGCNNQRTQPHDLAWERLSRYLRSREPPYRSGDRVRLHKVFPGAVKRSMLGVHLYFVKEFGCQIAEHNLPIDLASFSAAILQEKPHSGMFLALCPQIDVKFKSIGLSDITAVELGGHITFATWFYMLDRIMVRVMYAEAGERRQGLIDAWHPFKASKCIRISSSA